ncbi:MAG: cytidine deaminase [Planctomycetota bacterium]|nr:cytidine deaminase [Planctomycetota bacterium]
MSSSSAVTGTRDRRLAAEAIRVMHNAYAPYSGFHVGAALRTAAGEVFTGCNCENASYGLTICAERVAVGNAVAAGRREFEAIAIASGGNDFAAPCGACRQVLAEFAPDMRVIMVNRAGKRKVVTLNRLLPLAFSLRSRAKL